MYVVLRDLDPTDGGGHGKPVLDANSQTIPVGLDTTTGEAVPIFCVEGTEGNLEIPPDHLPCVQEAVLKRANMVRAPPSVLEHALEEVLARPSAATSITTDPPGRLVADGATINSPLENTAPDQLIMTAGGVNNWAEVAPNAAANLPGQIVDLLNSGWDPTGLLGGSSRRSCPSAWTPCSPSTPSLA